MRQTQQKTTPRDCCKGLSELVIVLQLTGVIDSRRPRPRSRKGTVKEHKEVDTGDDPKLKQKSTLRVVPLFYRDYKVCIISTWCCRSFSSKETHRKRFLFVPGGTGFECRVLKLDSVNGYPAPTGLSALG